MDYQQMINEFRENLRHPKCPSKKSSSKCHIGEYNWGIYGENLSHWGKVKSHDLAYTVKYFWTHPLSITIY